MMNSKRLRQTATQLDHLAIQMRALADELDQPDREQARGVIETENKAIALLAVTDVGRTLALAVNTVDDVREWRDARRAS